MSIINQEEYKLWNPTEEQLIRRLRAVLLIHACLYYRMDSPIITDAQFDSWSRELAEIPYREIGFYDEEFIDWDGSTGFHLPVDEYIYGKACELLATIDRLEKRRM